MTQKINLNTDLLNLVAGKHVQIVGPAPYLIGQNRGENFDSADIVVRLNAVIPPFELRCDYGSRTDIMFCNFGTPWMPGIIRGIKTGDHENHFKNLKLVVASAIKADHSESNFLSWPNDYVSRIPQNFKEINTYNLPFYWIGVEDYKKLYTEIGVEFNTGIAAISMLMRYPLKSLSLSGFSFFLGGNKYEDLYYQGHMDEIDKKGRKFGFSGGHGDCAHIKQIQYFIDLFKKSGSTIKIDNELRHLLSL